MSNKKASAFNLVNNILPTDLIPFVRPTESDPSLKNSIISGADLTSQINYPQVNTFADLPSASSNTGKIYIVLQGSGIYIVNRKSAGLYISNGTSWDRLGNIPAFFSDTNLKFYNGADNTKQLGLDLSNITTSTTRTINAPDRDLDLSNPTFDGLTSEDVINVNDTTQSTSSSTGSIQTNGGIGVAKNINVGGFVNLGSPIALTISSGEITANKSFHQIDTEGNAPTDDLDTINGGSSGAILILKTRNNNRDVVVKHGVGNIRLDGSADFNMDRNRNMLTLIRSGAIWIETSRASAI